MIKLVSQFDNENSKLSLATPTCGACCCCCCCCIITTLVTASISQRNFGQYLAKLDEEKTNQKSIVSKIILRLIGYFIYVVVSLITMFCVFASIFSPIKLYIFNYTIELTVGYFLIFALILVVISIFLLKKTKKQDIINKNSEQSITKTDETKPEVIVSKKTQFNAIFNAIFNLLIIILIILLLRFMGVNESWLIPLIVLIGFYDFCIILGKIKPKVIDSKKTKFIFYLLIIILIILSLCLMMRFDVSRLLLLIGLTGIYGFFRNLRKFIKKDIKKDDDKDIGGK